ncbi:hypothetical protein [Phenylobacterium sp.]|uniref:hypothetical protein n=1 Tax=Phenylobacterium sp. TaxID=1871053 RepID=UPI00301C0847
MLDKKALDRAEVAAQCPHCGHQQSAVFGQLKRDPRVTCLACGDAYDTEPDKLEQQIAQALRSAQQRLNRQMKRFK